MLASFAKRSSVAMFLGLTALSPAAVAPSYAQSYAFNNVEIQGAQRIEAATILSYLGVNRGETIAAGALNDGYQRLIGSGLFESVELLPQGNKLVIKVQEHPTVNVVSVEGNRRVKDEAFEPFLKTTPRRVYSPTVAEQDAQTIVEIYQAQGRLAAQVQPKIIRRSNNRVDVVFEVTEGKTVEVERLSFVNNRAFSDRRLRRVLETKQAGLLRAFIRADSYVPERIELDKRVLTDFYLSRGYVDFKVLSATSEFSRERDAFFVTFSVQEGQQFKLGNITTTTDQPEVNADEFAAASQLRTGQIYSPNIIENTIARMERLALQKGLNFIRVEPVVTRNARTRTLDIELVVTRGPRIIVERIDIEGNATTLDKVVRSQFRIAEGDPFNPREIREAAERVRALGFFTTADVQTRQGSAPDRVVVDVDLEEAPTGSLSFGGAYSLENGFGVNISYTQRNFLGRGQFLKLAFGNTSDTSTFALNFAEPRFLGRDVRFGLDASYSESEEASSALFDTKTFIFRPSIEFPISENGRIGLRAFVESNEMLNAESDSSQIIKNEVARGQQTGVGAGLTYSFDSRRTGLNPNAGILFRASADLGGFGTDYEYFKAEALARAQTKVLNDQVTLSATFEGGMVQGLDTGGVSRFTDRFHLGPSKLRGFATNGLGPRDLISTNQDALGGNYYAVARLEAEFPLGIPEEYGITGGLFLDAGALWGLDDTLGGSIDDDSHFRSSIGASIFWRTPIGPLRLNYSRVLEKQTYDIENEFELTISSQF
ncbi:outer membrane protein assembly factor BamA [Aliiroseovarius sp. KMU-50]|uniref:Outer membrane protein assembly factor BamA n=1 Tax=Aliiroseovarius salicola TaxID=3009082 RepID=A0ABT4W386_9RHOB|nr:outer membrane protein assembly factor BamA [Aliiroseovarius sp. KMU-50]MDA5094879.1 outer membrane protein assembly factor BamA [Aliiroseovarius sp. KMU-50]